MKQESREHFDAAEEFIREAELLASGGFCRGTVARAYYAMFHAATAALLERDIERGSHHGIIAAFGQRLVKTGEIPKQFHAYLQKAFEARMEVDYETTASLTLQEARIVIERARAFVDVCRQLSG